MLNWITLGYPSTPSRRAQAGEPLSADQYKVLETLQEHIHHFCDMPPFSQDDLGRFGEKFSALRKSVEELPDHLEVDLADIVAEIQHDFNSYSSSERPHFVDRDSHQEAHSHCVHEPSRVTIPNLNNKPVIASRIKWKHPPSFDPTPYLLDPIVRSVFLDPDVLRMPQCLWPDKPKARVHSTRHEILQLMKIWDAHNSLVLFPCHEIDERETVGLFAVAKDASFDRLIINPTVINSRMYPYSRYTKSLAPGALLSLLSLKPDQGFRFCADDLSDFYYTFRVPKKRARRNCIGLPIYDSEIQDLSCYDPAKSGPHYPALSTLAMGDSHAVEIAQASHHALLQIEAGCMLQCESLEYRRPVPRGDFIELLAIDDHIGVQRLSLSDLHAKRPARDTQVFEQANRAYAKVGLVSHPGKQRRCETKGVILGADFDGIKGKVCAPRTRIQLLSWVTAVICKKGTCTKQLLQAIVGCWIHVILFRRPLLSLIDALFHVGDNCSPTHVICLSSQV